MTDARLAGMDKSYESLESTRRPERSETRDSRAEEKYVDDSGDLM
jgi:hypothetical protein